MDTKRCPKCGETKPATLEYFYRSKQTHDGLFGWCKECAKANAKKYQGGDEWCAKRRQHYYDTHPGSGPMVRRTPEEARELRIATSRAWKERNPERSRAGHREWCHRNRVKCRAYESKRRARKLAAGGNGYTDEDVAAQMKRQKGRCYWCGEKAGKDYHVDHVFPIGKGGTDSPDNIVIACRACNLKKHVKLPHEFSDRLC